MFQKGIRDLPTFAFDIPTHGHLELSSRQGHRHLFTDEFLGLRSGFDVEHSVSTAV